MRIFIGYDSRETLAYAVLSHSIIRRASIPVSIAPLSLHGLSKIYTRTRGPLESTEFSISRFLVPYLSDFDGISVFMDCDMLCLIDMAELLPYLSECAQKYDVMVCKHDYVPKDNSKFLGNKQTPYQRKNWSSFMVFNNARCRVLTPSLVNVASGLDLHRFTWTDDSRIGSLPLELNWLVGEYHDCQSAKILHYTLGGPWFDAYAGSDRAADWVAEHRHMVGVDLGA